MSSAASKGSELGPSLPDVLGSTASDGASGTGAKGVTVSAVAILDPETNQHVRIASYRTANLLG